MDQFVTLSDPSLAFSDELAPMSTATGTTTTSNTSTSNSGNGFMSFMTNLFGLTEGFKNAADNVLGVFGRDSSTADAKEALAVQQQMYTLQQEQAKKQQQTIIVAAVVVVVAIIVTLLITKTSK